MVAFCDCSTLQRGSSIVGSVLCAASALFVLAGVLWIIDNSDRTALILQSPPANSVVSAPSVEQSLPTDPTDPVVAADIATVRAFRDALERELATTEARLAATRDQQEIKRRLVLEKMLKNPGHSGLDDRLAEIDEALRIQGSALRLLPRNRELTRNAIEHIHTTAVSCRSGALKQARESLGIPKS